ncbi:hypothetical protein GGTG_07635 [Gaeumannomyces tritici R3-111a-1]|uniref:Uncharacterized protein n=1 Tax=Gaeumannomyces tritici (strain R3-111a-1) TaxID=644352 RepID=J3P287_GAET3|nr:hypothetical protein GGTG_07635 [Gaeumannomyces tritici R3-111a-1]EJT73779.1 hypothetical protein GGTG_07635 [Gaeumannomyces tritici R3-111a-1]
MIRGMSRLYFAPYTWACVGIPPNVCCSYGGANTGRASIAVVAIRSGWRICARSYTGDGYRFFGTEQCNNGRTSFCLPYTTRGDRSGAHIWFVNRKRAADESCPAEQPGTGTEKCTASVMYNTIGLADGTEYDIAGLSEAQVEELDKISVSGAGVEAVPASFALHRR